ncbi:hypothetical protein KEF85_07845 [Methylomonas paludis]|uniref:LTXXQ motif family protein n=1 Tax=Methylomonas paludis TaxID=1173101 RepID=A0A975RAN6_9GAMM|nr:hypothetical protein [Methylomonas paludis]QWF72347.1 hypothetical protein KEF85_07845 [Methylomonas paludis]
MLKILLFSTLCLSPLLAHSEAVESGYIGTHGHRLEHLSKELALTADQKAKLETIFQEQSEKFRAIHEESHNRIKQVLDADQFGKWEKLITERKNKFQHRHFNQSPQ